MKNMKRTSEQKMKNSTKCGFVTLIGLPNSGKSTLINLLVNEKISIVSFKAQTTRNEIRGIVEYDNSQVIYVDTPGICNTNSDLEKILFKNFKSALRNADVVIILIDGSDKFNLNKLKFLQDNKQLINKPVAIAINKVDLILHKEKLLQIAGKLRDLGYVKEIFMISALKNHGIEPLKKFAQQNVPDGVWFYTDEHDVTDTNLKTRLSEITREKLFENLGEELPYSIYVTTDYLRITEKKFKIIQTIVTMKDSQKGIIIGYKGKMIYRVRMSSIAEMKRIFHKNVELELFVRVREKWSIHKDYLIDAGIISK